MKRPKNPIKITPAHIEALHAAKKDTGYGESMFLRWVDNVPTGLSSTTIYQWMHGNVVEANRDLLEFVLENWPKAPRRIEITDEIIQRLRDEQARTGLGQSRLLKTMSEVPRGLTATKIGHWKSKVSTKAREDHIDAVLAAYAVIPST